MYSASRWAIPRVQRRLRLKLKYTWQLTPNGKLPTGSANQILITTVVEVASVGLAQARPNYVERAALLKKDGCFMPPGFC